MEATTEKLLAMVEKHSALICRAQEYIFDNPETGFQEWNTSNYMAENFRKLGYTPVEAGNIPGFYADLDTGKPGPTIAVFGELDALVIPSHPKAKNGIVHACGHNAQSAMLLGIAAALKEPGALDDLCGKIRLISVPAEEMVQVEFRQELVKKGTIHFMHGKGEFIYRGFLNGVDAAFMFHAAKIREESDFFCRPGSNGLLAKTAYYHGKSAHAGCSPQNGVNALYAGTLGLQAINSIRETFVDDEHVRVHPIMDLGNGSVNAIPDYAKIESYVRGATLESIRENNKKVNRALAGAALSMGAGLEIQEGGCYAPLNTDPGMMEVARICMEAVSPGRVDITPMRESGSTDMGDISTIMPAVQPYACGADGTGHGDDYAIADPIKACVNPAKAGFLMLHELLKNDGAKTYEIKKNFHPIYAGVQDYCKAMDEMMAHWELTTTMEEDGSFHAEWKRD